MSFLGELLGGIVQRQQPWEKALGGALRNTGLSTAKELPRSEREQLLREQITTGEPIEASLNAYFTTINYFGHDALASLVENGTVVVEMEVETPEWPYRKKLTPTELALRLREAAIRDGWNCGG